MMKLVSSLLMSEKTLLVIPCSGAKRPGYKSTAPRSILSALDPANAVALANARQALSQIASINEETVMPAYLRYHGQLYQQCSASIGRVITTGQRVLIVSGGYGLLVADEPIGLYDKRFALSDWPMGLLETCIEDYTRHEEIRSVIAVMSDTTGYAKLVRSVNWKRAALTTNLVSPIAEGGGPWLKCLARKARQ
jgi:hypothetical protein